MPIGDQFGQPGFPGFDGLFASTTLAYVAQMQEAGIPVTFGYISDAHDQHGVAGEIHATRGPGEADYVQQLKNYDDAFGSSSTGWRRTASTRATRCSSSPSRRATTSQAHSRRRPGATA